MRGCVKQLRIGREYVLRAVAVMDVEIDDGNTLEPVLRAGMQCAHCNIVEQTESHRLGWCGMMSRRADSAECVLRLAGHDHVYGKYDRARRAQRRIPSAR